METHMLVPGMGSGEREVLFPLLHHQNQGQPREWSGKRVSTGQAKDCFTQSPITRWNSLAILQSML